MHNESAHEMSDAQISCTKVDDNFDFWATSNNFLRGVNPICGFTNCHHCNRRKILP